MFKFICFTTICIFLISCASTSTKVYKNDVFTKNSKYSVVFAYETSEEETSVNKDGIKKKITRKGHSSSTLALKDNIYFNLLDRGVRLEDDSNLSDIKIELHPTTRVSNCNLTCGAINTLSIVFRDTPKNKPIARIVVKNGDRVASTMDEIEFSNYASRKIYSLIRR